MSTIQIVKTSITDISVDAIVNAANNELRAGGGVCGCIFQAAGRDELTGACQKIGHCDTGNAVITPGFHSRAKYIIHTVGPVWKDGQQNEAKQLYDCFYRSLTLAKEAKCSSVAFPLLSAGKFGYPKEGAWRKAVQACNDFVQDNPNYEVAIYFAVLDDKLITMGKDTVEKYWQKYAKRTDGKTCGMPKRCARFRMKRHLCYEEYKRLRYGCIPESMDDKWFLYLEGNKLYFHRSWTGYCIYIAEFLPNDIIEVTVNRNPKQYGRTSLFDDFNTFSGMLTGWAGSRFLEHYDDAILEDILLKDNQVIHIDKLNIGKQKPQYAVCFHKPEEPNGAFSNWYPAKFEVDGETFTSAEQYIMYRKSKIFGDDKAAKAIMETDNPALQQKIGRNATGYVDIIWAGIRQLVLERALEAKFSQNEALRDMLLATEDAYLVECAESDRVWACGVSLYHDDKGQISKWNGQNILGFTLMTVRERLREKSWHSSDYAVDTHSHVVYNVDDGAVDCTMSLKMLQSMEAQGVKHVFCTSHSSSDRKKYVHNFEALKKAASEAGLHIELHTGCEIYCSEQNIGTVIDRLNDGSYPTLADSQYALLEFPKNVTAHEIIYCVKAIVELMEYQSEKKTIIPVIAHAEQYRSLYRDKNGYNLLKCFHINIQINAYSLVEEQDEEIRSLARQLLDDELVTFIGSDCHRTDHRPPKLQTGISYIYENCDPEYAKDICCRNAERMLLNKI